MSAMPGPAALREVPTDSLGRLAESVACRRCGYQLMGLPTSGRCPECGTSVGWSIHGDLLQFSDPDWVRKLADGALWMIIGVFAQLGAGIVGTVVGALNGTQVAVPALALGAEGVILVAYWKFTAPDPGHVAGERRWNIRRVTRALAVAGFMSGVVGLVHSLPGIILGPAYVPLVGLSALLQLVALVGALLLFILVRRLALRVPDPRLASQTRVVMWGLVSLSGVMIVLGAVVMVLAIGMSGGMNPSGPGITLATIAVAFCGIGVAMFVFAIWWIVLLFWYRRALMKAAGVAMTSWMSASDQPPAES